MGRSTVALAVSMLAVGLATVVAAQGQPVPRPFPGGRTPAPPAATQPAPAPPPATPPAGAAPAAAQPAGSPEAALAGIPLFPSAQFLDSYDAGQGQRYYLYGANAPFEAVVSHFRTALRGGGRQLYRTPAIHQFDLGRFESDQMAFPPSVVVKDYAGGTGGGYLFVRDAVEQRFRTIIQIVPPTK